jgi:hypothetical protein
VETVVMGNVVQAGTKMNPSRQAAVNAGLPVTTLSRARRGADRERKARPDLNLGNRVAVRAMRVPVSRRAILQRLRRGFRAKGRDVNVSRVTQRKAVEKFYLIDRECGPGTDADIEALARELGLLRPWERLGES